MIGSPAHHRKEDGPNRHDLQAEALVAAWRLRRASGFVAVDTHSVRERRSADRRLIALRARAHVWLNCLKARRRQAAKDARRAHLRLLSGGRS